MDTSAFIKAAAPQQTWLEETRRNMENHSVKASIPEEPMSGLVSMNAVDLGVEANKGNVENIMGVDAGTSRTGDSFAAEVDEADVRLGPAAARAEMSVDMLGPTGGSNMEARNDTNACRRLDVPDADKKCFSDGKPDPVPNKRAEEKPFFDEGAKRARVDIEQTEKLCGLSTRPSVEAATKGNGCGLVKEQDLDTECSDWGGESAAETKCMKEMSYSKSGKEAVAIGMEPAGVPAAPTAGEKAIEAMKMLPQATEPSCDLGTKEERKNPEGDVPEKPKQCQIQGDFYASEKPRRTEPGAGQSPEENGLLPIMNADEDVRMDAAEVCAKKEAASVLAHEAPAGKHPEALETAHGVQRGASAFQSIFSPHENTRIQSPKSLILARLPLWTCMALVLSMIAARNSKVP